MSQNNRLPDHPSLPRHNTIQQRTQDGPSHQQTNTSSKTQAPKRETLGSYLYPLTGGNQSWDYSPQSHSQPPCDLNLYQPVSQGWSRTQSPTPAGSHLQVPEWENPSPGFHLFLVPPTLRACESPGIWYQLTAAGALVLLSHENVPHPPAGDPSYKSS